MNLQQMIEDHINSIKLHAADLAAKAAAIGDGSAEQTHFNIGRLAWCSTEIVKLHAGLQRLQEIQHLERCGVTTLRGTVAPEEKPEPIGT